jgi:toxin YoeB
MSKRELHFNDGGWSDYLYWHKTDKKLFARLVRLLEEVRRTPFEGIGKPEALKGNYTGLWSRRLTEEHRLVYQVTDEAIKVIGCRHHYDENSQ